jgi:hypothetical protein
MLSMTALQAAANASISRLRGFFSTFRLTQPEDSNVSIIQVIQEKAYTLCNKVRLSPPLCLAVSFTSFCTVDTSKQLPWRTCGVGRTPLPSSSHERTKWLQVCC